MCFRQLLRVSHLKWHNHVKDERNISQVGNSSLRSVPEGSACCRKWELTNERCTAALNRGPYTCRASLRIDGSLGRQTSESAALWIEILSPAKGLWAVFVVDHLFWRAALAEEYFGELKFDAVNWEAEWLASKQC